MGQVAYSTSFEIATAIKNRLLEQNILPSRRIVIGCRRFDWVAPKADHFIVVRPSDLSVYQDWAESKGRHATMANREFVVDLYTRLATDDILKDENWAETQLAYEDAIVDALHIWLPTEAGGNSLTVCPLHWTSTTHPNKEESVPGWGTSIIAFRTDFLQAFTGPFTDPAG